MSEDNIEFEYKSRRIKYAGKDKQKKEKYMSRIMTIGFLMIFFIVGFILGLAVSNMFW